MFEVGNIYTVGTVEKEPKEKLLILGVLKGINQYNIIQGKKLKTLSENEMQKLGLEKEDLNGDLDSLSKDLLLYFELYKKNNELEKSSKILQKQQEELAVEMYKLQQNLSNESEFEAMLSRLETNLPYEVTLNSEFYIQKTYRKNKLNIVLQFYNCTPIKKEHKNWLEKNSETKLLRLKESLNREALTEYAPPIDKTKIYVLINNNLNEYANLISLKRANEDIFEYNNHKKCFDLEYEFIFEIKESKEVADVEEFKYKFKNLVKALDSLIEEELSNLI